MTTANRLGSGSVLRLLKSISGLVVLCAILVVPKLPAQSTEEFDYYHVKLGGFWVYSTPTGTIQGSATTDLGPVDLNAAS